jgi:hypothetical protein
VSMTTNPREGKSSDAVLAELTQAMEQVAREARPLARPSEEVFEREDATAQPPNGNGLPPSWVACRGLARGRYGVSSACCL